ncbi:hypothetical protein LN565_02790 [Xanthomonas euvesicatoria pv. euvesicatoria]|uniref:hypothetical protein n=1 Tax=Xanthomonas euvesicatoria TaxID=456327 RepID=UPI000575245E|nr:hypothetical protein [Xanthomonas euvesicatoria]AOY68796.1 hypothetical protein BHE83_21170 [Xanthomonas euvesicatoria pv. vesicatoria str. 85-10]APO91406.1 hypothetical protein BJD11_16440 [Xanthomonas euvesicatoria]KHL61794.1 hypothetical protein XEU66b_09650 [Xanthomonas euvesicatoria]KHL64059.1 hypothetical protein XEU83M_19305 [Xanthomonas euvesicatoria]KLA52424.1 hypothetical protein XEUV685_17445 [Xanthomonas euvesicatoria]
MTVATSTCHGLHVRDTSTAHGDGQANHAWPRANACACTGSRVDTGFIPHGVGGQKDRAPCPPNCLDQMLTVFRSLPGPLQLATHVERSVEP